MYLRYERLLKSIAGELCFTFGLYSPGPGAGEFLTGERFTPIVMFLVQALGSW